MMHKLGALLVLTLLVLGSCGPSHMNIRVYDDDIKNEKVALFRIFKRSNDGIRSESIYSKVFGHDNSKVIKIKFIIKLNEDDENLKDMAFIKFDDRVKKLQLKNLTSSVETGKVHDGEDIDYFKYKMVSGQLKVSEELKRLFLNSSQMILQLYCGERPLKFSFNQKDMNHIQGLILYENGTARRK